MVKQIKEKSVVYDNPKLPYITIKPNTHEDWLLERNKGIGASECGKIIGCSKYGTPYSLFCDKIGIGERIEENWAMRQGHIFEREVAEQFQRDMGMSVIGLHQSTNVKADWLACSREHDFLRVSPDYLYWLKEANGKDKPHNLFNRGVLECKTSVHHYKPECLQNECISWYCQVQYQLYVLGLKDAYLGFLCVDSLTGGESWFEYIPYNEKFCKETLIPSIIEFWTKHIAPARAAIADGCTTDTVMQFAPVITNADDITKRYPKESEGKSINGTDIPDFFDKLGVYIQRKSAIKELEQQQKEFEDEIKLFMADAESIVGTDNKAIVTFKSAKPSMKFDSAKFKAECSEQYSQYCSEVPGSRRLIFK